MNADCLSLSPNSVGEMDWTARIVRLVGGAGGREDAEAIMAGWGSIGMVGMGITLR